MTVAYFDCFSGICGDMILGALVDLGLDIKFLKKELEKLNLSGYEILVEKKQQHHIACTDVDIVVSEQQSHRTFKDIKTIISKSTLDNEIKKTSITIFHKLAIAESKVHHTAVDHIHFHEVGAVDSIIDIVGAVIGLKKLNITEVFCSPLPLGRGFVTCDHGVLPIPAPATVELLKNVPVYQTDRKQELVTPTGAAIITTVAEKFGEMPQMKYQKIGYGCGKTKSTYPNVLRVFLGLNKKEKKGKIMI